MGSALRVYKQSGDLQIRHKQKNKRTPTRLIAVHGSLHRHALRLLPLDPVGAVRRTRAVFSRAAPRPHSLAWIPDAPPRAWIPLGEEAASRKPAFFAYFLCGGKESKSPKAKAFDV